MPSVATTTYLIAEGLIGEGTIWRVVREEVDDAGQRLIAFVAVCQTQRAALSLARALNDKRSTDGAAPIDPAGRRGHIKLAAEPPPLDAYRLRPSC